MPKPMEIAGIRYAVAHAGSQKKLAGVLGVSATAVNRWVRQGFVSDREKIKQISRLYGIPPSRLCDPEFLELICGGDDDS